MSKMSNQSEIEQSEKLFWSHLLMLKRQQMSENELAEQINLTINVTLLN